MNAKSSILVAALLLTLAGHVLAVQEAPDAERTQQLQRDRALIEVLVRGGLDLAGEDDPLQRAAHCGRIAEVYGKEVKRAVDKKDDLRAALLGQQMQVMLEQGVAGNLTEARQKLATDAAADEQIDNLGKKMAAAAKSIEEQIDNARLTSGSDAEKWRPMLEAVNKGKTAVDQAVKNKPKAKDKGPHPTKKGKTN
jgi:hypothetical protein